MRERPHQNENNEKSIREQVYASLRGVSEAELDAFWNSLEFKIPVFEEGRENLVASDYITDADVEVWRKVLAQRRMVHLPKLNWDNANDVHEADSRERTHIMSGVLIQDQIKFNLVAKKLHAEFERARAEQVRQFYSIFLPNLNAWIAACNETNFKHMNQLGTELSEYLYRSAEPKVLPLHKEESSDDRFSGLVSKEAAALYKKFDQVRKWFRDEGTMTKRIAPFYTVEEFLASSRDEFLHREISPKTRRDRDSAAD